MADGEDPEQDNPGIRISAGMAFRISNLSLTFDPETGELKSAGQIRSELRNDIFHHWLRISEQEAERAQRARNVAEGATDRDGQEFNDALDDEFRASLLAVAAAAFAIDAFYASAIHQAPETRVVSRTRDASIFETLKRGFALTGRQQKALRKPIRALFRARDEAVHPPTRWAVPISHPAFKVGMDPKLVAYRAEVGREAATLAQQIIWTCLQVPKQRFPELTAWATELSAMVEKPPLPDNWLS
jgi:hypothetical protein